MADKEQQGQDLVDVLIIGAGFAGVAAAMELQEHKTVRIIEALDRVGGRAWTETLPDGRVVDHGAHYLGTLHERLMGLVDELGLTDQLMDYVPGFGPDPVGVSLLAGDRIVTRRSETWFQIQGMDGRATWADQARYLRVLLLADMLCDSIDTRAPWEGPHARWLDSMTWGDWVRSLRLPRWFADLMISGVAGVWSQDADEMSLLYVLWYIKSNGGIGKIFTDQEDSPQQFGLRCGMQGLLQRWMQRYRGELCLGEGVERIEVGPAEVRVYTTSGRVHRARDVILTVTPRAARHITFDPPLPPERRLLLDQPGGYAVKCTVIYDHPWYRERKRPEDHVFGWLAGEGTDGVNWMLDTADPDGGAYILCMFLHPSFMDRIADLSWEEQKQHIAEALVQLAQDPRAADFRHLTLCDWRGQAGFDGGPNTNLRPGVITTVGDAMYAPDHGRLHWAGADLSPHFTGYLEGAIASGRDVAARLLEVQPSPPAGVRRFKRGVVLKGSLLPAFTVATGVLQAGSRLRRRLVGAPEAP